MSRASVVLNTPAARATVARWVMAVPFGTRVEFKAPKRSLPQNARMWAMLTDIAVQTTHADMKHSPDVWKCLFISAMGQETKFIPALDGKSVVPIMHRSSDLSKGEMTDLIEFMMEWGTQKGVKFHDDKPDQFGKDA